MTTPTTPDWPLVYPNACSALDGMEPEERDAIEQMAVAWLTAWTGYGTTPVVVRPCRADCSGATTFWSSPTWRGCGPQPCGRCFDACSCGRGGTTLRLPGTVAAIDEIRIDGSPVDPALYRVDNYSLLVDTSGGRWPTCQDMSLPPTEVGTWQVAYQQGLPVPIGGQIAAGVLACELGKAAIGDATCQLPRRVTSVQRQGVSMSMDPTALDKGATGVWLVDSWVQMVTRPVKGARVRSVDVPHPRHRVTTWTADV